MNAKQMNGCGLHMVCLPGRQDFFRQVESSLEQLGLEARQGYCTRTESYLVASLSLPALEDADALRLLTALLPLVRHGRGALYLSRSEALWPIRYVFADLDGTLIPDEVMIALARQRGLGEAMSRLTMEAMLGQSSFAESFAQRSRMLKGLRLSEVAQVVDEVEIPLDVLRWIGTLKRSGIGLEVVSGAYREVVAPLCMRLGVRDYCASAALFEGDYFTGTLTEPLVDDLYKADYVRFRTIARGILPLRVMAIGDGANDLPMLSQAAHALLFASPREARGLSLEQLWHFVQQDIRY
ncbi:HAD family phosphatase [Porphyromonas sp. COT-239 OH1446]|uniref:HAD family hydrolase n=1 Tax=Porphyromonas sp. COT-239 OH1446 TaxID=1515613 RepID=UPI0009DFC284|nr:HAD-IB family phosphatase [Porphyromonas sp. COT-239 OH1446]